MALADLTIYKKSLRLVKEVYDLIKNNTQLQKDYSLCDQIKRSSVSVTANISEGYLQGKKIFKNYLRIANGSANETTTLLEVIALVHGVKTDKIQEEYRYLSKQISAFSSSFN